jgi:hypothetical protein
LHCNRTVNPNSIDKVPEWIEELFRQADESCNGYVSSDEICEYLEFVFPNTSPSELAASFACVNSPSHLDIVEFYLWATQNQHLFEKGGGGGGDAPALPSPPMAPILDEASAVMDMTRG